MRHIIHRFIIATGLCKTVRNARVAMHENRSIGSFERALVQIATWAKPHRYTPFAKMIPPAPDFKMIALGGSIQLAGRG